MELIHIKELSHEDVDSLRGKSERFYLNIVNLKGGNAAYLEPILK
ncbi:MAG: hypothetical protein AB1632_05310 [Nitrospirota bacterium]